MSANGLSTVNVESDIDVSVSSLMKLYPVTENYKSKLKAGNGRVIPFEQIEKGFYKSTANCVTFVTNNKRIHMWIHAFAELVYNQEGKGEKFVRWIDKKDQNDKIVQTEFIVYDEDNDPLLDDAHLYKVIVYITNGKIMIQGKEWEDFCDRKFQQSLAIVNKASNTCVIPHEIPNTVVNDKIEIENSDGIVDKEETEVKTIASSDESQITDSITKVDESPDHISSTPSNSKPTNKQNSDNNSDNFKLVNGRIDILEQSVVKMTNTLTTSIEYHQGEIVKLMDSIKHLKSDLKSQFQPDISFMEKSLKEKDLVINNLKHELMDKDKALQSQSVDSEKNLQAQRKEFESVIRELQNEADIIREQRARAQAETDKLSSLIDQYENEKSVIHKEFQKRIEDRDKTIINLQDRIQSYLYDKEGEPWSKVNHESQDHENKSEVMNDISNTQQDDTYNSNPSNRAEKTANEKYDILFIHDSICNFVNINGLLAGSNRNGEKCVTYTIEDAKQKLEFVHSTKTLIVHVALNDLKKPDESAERIFDRYSTLINKATEIAEHIVLSLVVPTKFGKLNKKIQEFNEMVVTKFGSTAGISLCKNQNFISNGRVLFQLYQDAYKLSKENGTRVLAGNIRNTLFPRMRQSDSKPQGNGNTYPRSNTRQNRQHSGHYSAFNERQNPGHYSEFNERRPPMYGYNRPSPGQNVRPPMGPNFSSASNLNMSALANGIVSAIASAFNQ